MIYAEIPRGRGNVLRISRDQFNDHELVGIRQWCEYTPGDRDTLRPSKSGVSIPVRLLPALLEALQVAKAYAIADGTLHPNSHNGTQ